MPGSSIKMLGKLAIGEILHAGQELDNAVDKFTLRVVQNSETVGHLLCKYSRILWLSHVAENYCKRLCVGMEIPCWLVFSCSSKVKINLLKELFCGEQDSPINTRRRRLL